MAISFVTNQSTEFGNDFEALIVKANEELSSYALDRAAIRALPRGSEKCEFVYQYPPPLCLPSLNSDYTMKTLEMSDSLQDRSFGLYIHIPFCASSCSFCHYTRWVPRNDKEVWTYLRALEQEIRLTGQLLNAGTREVSTIHFGGGTPTYLTSDQIHFLSVMLFEAFRIRRDAEITWETTPHDFVLRRFSAIKDMGGNRLSIGVQSLDETVLRLCGRAHGRQDAIGMMRTALSAGFEKVNADVIFGLPGQSVSSWIRTIEELIELEVPSVTMYRLRILPGTCLPREALSRLPNLRENDLMYIISQDMLQKAGYLQISPSCFIKSRRFLYKHQDDKAQGGEYVGLGLSAYSYFAGMVRFNTRDIGHYCAATQAGKLPVGVGKVLTAKESLIRQTILALRYGQGIRPTLARYIGRFEQKELHQSLRHLFDLKLLKFVHRWIKLTKMGQLLADEACRELYEQKYKLQLLRRGHQFGAYFTDCKGLKFMSSEDVENYVRA